MTTVTVLAATGMVGQALIECLVANGREVIAVGRDPAKLAQLPAGSITRIADLTDVPALRAALADCRYIACCANAVHLPAVLDALPTATTQRLVVLGSTRLFSEIPDETREAVRRARDLLAAQPVPWVLLLSTLIYGRSDAGVMGGLLRLMRRLPFLPLPGGGNARVQPIHVADVAASIDAALFSAEAEGRQIVIAGPVAISYRAFAERIAVAHHLRPILIPIPASLTRAAARLMVGPLGSVGSALRRRLEDSAFDVSEMRDRLGVSPRPFDPSVATGSTISSSQPGTHYAF